MDSVGITKFDLRVTVRSVFRKILAQVHPVNQSLVAIPVGQCQRNLRATLSPQSDSEEYPVCF